MSEYNVSLVPIKEWKGGFTMDIEVANTGSEPLTDFSVDVSTTSADLLKSWGGSHDYLGDGIYRLTFDEAIEPGETVTMGIKAKGTDDLELIGSSEPVSGSDPVTEPAPEPTSPTPMPEPDLGGTEISVGSGTTAAELQALIDGAAEGTVIRLEAGRYNFDSTIQLDRDGVSVVGAGAGETVIDVSGLGQEAFSVGTGDRSGNYTLGRDVAEGGSVIELTGSHSFKAGDYVYLARESTEAFYDEIGDETWRNTDVPLRTSIVRVESVNGNTLTLERGVHFDFTTGETTVQEIDMVEGAALGGFTVDYGLGTADPSNFENTLSEYHRDAVIQVEGTAGLQLFDVTANDVPSLGVNVALSTGASVDSIEMTGAHNKGSGGNGYALQIRDVYDSSFTNLTDQDMRHSVVFASWRSSADNTVHVSSTDRDINFHGGRDHGNVVMVDQSIRDAESDVISPTLFVNTEGTHYGSVTDADANTALFGHVVGSRRADDIQAYDTGAYLDGAGGHDTLTGGAGNDMLIGGEGDDHLIGGGGEDIARMSGGRADYDVSVSGGTVQVDEVSGYDTDTLEGVEWVLFSDAALRVSDMSWHDPSATDGIFTGAGQWDPASWDYLAGTTSRTTYTATSDSPDGSTSSSTDGSTGDSTPTGDGPVLYGTDGKDVFVVDQPETTVHGLGNWDVVESSVDFTMLDDVEKLELTGTAAIDGTGSGSADLLLGNDSANVLRGKGGHDRIWGRDGDDTLRGGWGADELDAQSGDDILFGGAGADTLTGGDGADLFVVRNVSHSSAGAADRILDFGDGADRIDLSGIDADTTRSGDQAFELGGSGAGALWLESGTLMGDVDGDNIADLCIDLGGASVTESDFIL